MLAELEGRPLMPGPEGVWKMPSSALWACDGSEAVVFLPVFLLFRGLPPVLRLGKEE